MSNSPDRLHTFLSQIASVIRDKTDTEVEIEANTMPEKISDIGGGGVMVSQFTVSNFPDTNTLMVQGDVIDWSKVIAQIVLDNGFSYDLANEQLSFYPTGMLIPSDTAAMVSYDWGNQHLVYSKPITVYGYDELDEIIPKLPSTLNECGWGTIKALSVGGVLTDHYAIGSTKSFTFSLSDDYSGVASYAQAVLVGYNHNKELESPDKNVAHFTLNYNPDTKNIYGLYDSSYNDTPGNWNKKWFVMNQTATNAGGWKASFMRNDVLGNADGYTPMAPKEGSLMAALPLDLRNVMTFCNKWTDNVGGGTGQLEENVSGTNDYLSMVSSIELTGQNTLINSYEGRKQTQYQFFKNSPSNGSPSIRRYSSGTTAGSVWTRSSYYADGGSFRYVYGRSSAAYLPARYDLGIMPLLFI